MISHETVQQMSLLLSRCPSVYILFYCLKKISWHFSHELKAHASVSQTDSAKTEPPLDVAEEQGQFHSSLTTILVWEWPMQGVIFRSSSKGSVRDGQRTTFLQKTHQTTEDLSILRTGKFPCPIPRVLSRPCGSKLQGSKVWTTFSWEWWWDSS